MNNRLMQCFDFSEEDLEYNRQGRLSPRQNIRLTSRRRSHKRFLLLFGLLLSGVGGGILAWQGYLTLPKDNFSGMGLLVGAGIFVLLGAPLISLGLKPPRAVKASVAKGTAHIARVQRTRRANNVTNTYLATELHLGDKIFTVPDQALPALEAGALYAVYYWDGIDEIFSLERL